MANKFLKDEFIPKNPHKYVGQGKIIYRSGWEKKVMETFDMHPDVISWASEPFSLPYRHPLTGRHTVYVPDFIIMYADATGRQRCEMIEVKPYKEVPGVPVTGRGKSAQKTILTQKINEAKWAAARAFCTKRGIYFRVMTENEIFLWGTRGKK